MRANVGVQNRAPRRRVTAIPPARATGIAASDLAARPRFIAWVPSRTIVLQKLPVRVNETHSQPTDPRTMARPAILRRIMRVSWSGVPKGLTAVGHEFGTPPCPAVHNVCTRQV